MKAKDVLIIGGVAFLGYQVIKNKSEDGGGLNLLGGIGGGLLDLSDLFGGLTDMFSGVTEGIFSSMPDFGGLFGGIQDTFSTMMQGFNDAWSRTWGGGGDGGGGGEPGTPGTPGTPGAPGGGWFEPPLVMPTGNTWTDISNAVSQGAMTLAKAGLTGVGIYAGAKVGIPFLKATVPALNTPVGTALKTGGNMVTSTMRGAANVGRSGAGYLLNLLKSPVTKLGVGGTAMAVPMLGAAAWGGWELGQAFNRTAAGQALQEWSGEMGAKVGGGENFVQKFLFPHAGETTWSPSQSEKIRDLTGVSYGQTGSMTSSELNALIKRISEAKQNNRVVTTGGGRSTNGGGTITTEDDKKKKKKTITHVPAQVNVGGYTAAQMAIMAQKQAAALGR